MSADPTLFWYFAYGSNLDPRTFLGRRRMRPVETAVTVLADWRLVFGLPIGPGERGVANVLPAEGQSVTGVAYRITDEQARHLDGTEGVPRAYRREAVSLTLEDGAGLAGFTYVSPHHHEGRKPSSRYLGLLLRGARYHGLPAEYVAQLRALEIAVDERDPQMELYER